mgnify:CR=1 FL=1
MNKKYYLNASLIVLMAAVLGFTGCNKDNNPAPWLGIGQVAFLNALIGSDSLNFYVDTDKLNDSLLHYTDSMHYVEIDGGERLFELRRNTSPSLAKDTFEIVHSRSYTVLAAFNASRDTVQLVSLTDDLTPPFSGKAKIRLIQASPDAGKLSLVLGETRLADKIDYKAASSFATVDARTVSLTIVDPETGNTVLPLPPLSLTAGKIYTLWLTGLAGTDDEDLALKANVFVHNPE